MSNHRRRHIGKTARRLGAGLLALFVLGASLLCGFAPPMAESSVMTADHSVVSAGEPPRFAAAVVCLAVVVPLPRVPIASAEIVLAENLARSGSPPETRLRV